MRFAKPWITRLATPRALLRDRPKEKTPPSASRPSTGATALPAPVHQRESPLERQEVAIQSDQRRIADCHRHEGRGNQNESAGRLQLEKARDRAKGYPKHIVSLHDASETY